MGRIIAFANQKGGVGKTTSAVNIAADLGHLGYSTLLIDCDPQGNASSAVGAVNDKSDTFDILINGENPENAVQKTKFKNLSVIPSDMNLAAADLELSNKEKRETILREALFPLKEKFDFIVLDCPPSLSLLTINALSACDSVVVPMQCEYFALEGLSQLIFSLKQVKRLYNPSIDLLGIILTMFDGRLNLSLQVMEELKKYFPDKIFTHSIPRAVRLSEAPSHSKPILYYDKYSKGSLSYLEVTKELVKRCDGK